MGHGAASSCGGRSVSGASACTVAEFRLLVGVVPNGAAPTGMCSLRTWRLRGVSVSQIVGGAQHNGT